MNCDAFFVEFSDDPLLLHVMEAEKSNLKFFIIFRPFCAMHGNLV